MQHQLRSMISSASNPEGRTTLGLTKTETFHCPSDDFSERNTPRSVVQITDSASYRSRLVPNPSPSSISDGLYGVFGAMCRNSKSQDVTPSPAFLLRPCARLVILFMRRPKRFVICGTTASGTVA